jgi:hypothetical protein
MAALTADIAFEQTANAAAAAWAARPAYVTYVARTHIEAPSVGQSVEVDRRMMVRSSDDRAIIQDLPNGGVTIGNSFPISPTFDALSYFRLETAIGWHKRLSSRVIGPDGKGQIIPLQFQNVVPNPNAVVVTALRFYYPKFAPDSSDAPDGRMHITMEALPTLTNNNKSDFYISDVIVDNRTMLPLQVTYTGRGQRRFIIDYQTDQGHWVVKHAFFEQTLSGVLHIGRVHYSADATFSDYAFPADPPDPRLAPLPTASPPAIPPAK